MTDRICEDCSQEVVGKYRRRRCEKCYRAVLRRLKGLAERKIRTHSQSEHAEVVFGKAVPAWGGCVIYNGPTNRDGYGRFHVGEGRSDNAHRVAYELLVGPIPAGLELDHLCHTRSATCPGGRSCLHRRCVNPGHLEPVTREENIRRASIRDAGFRKFSLMNQCGKGHEYTPDNTYWEPRKKSPGGHQRKCRTCLRSYWRERNELRRAQFPVVAG